MHLKTCESGFSVHFRNLIHSFLNCVYYGFRLFVLTLLDLGPSFSPDQQPRGLYGFFDCLKLFALSERTDERCGMVSTMYAKQTNIQSHTLRRLPSAFSSSSAGLNLSVYFNFGISFLKQVNSA